MLKYVAMLEFYVLKKHLPKEVYISYFNQITSTNDYLLALKNTCKINLCYAKHQMQGRGQFARVWQAQKNQSALFSIRYRFNNQIKKNLSLAIGVSIAQILNDNGIKVALKWPNDIYHNNKKLAGILIENTTLENKFFSIIGVGLNVYSNKNLNYAFLNDIIENAENENLVVNIIKNIIATCEEFTKKDFSFYKNEWQKYDMQLGKKVLHNEQSAKIIGIDNEGNLLIQKQNKQIITIVSSSQICYI